MSRDLISVRRDNMSITLLSPIADCGMGVVCLSPLSGGGVFLWSRAPLRESCGAMQKQNR